MKINYEIAWHGLWGLLSPMEHLSIMRRIGYFGRMPKRPISPALIARLLNLQATTGEITKQDKSCHKDRFQALL